MLLAPWYFAVMSTKIDAYSLCAVPVEQFFDNKSLGTATAFVWERRDKFYLITNWHVVTCRNNETGEHLTSHAAEPNWLRATFHPKAGMFETCSRDIELRGVERQPKWLFHPVYRRKVDVVAIPLDPPEGEVGFRPINKLRQERLSVQIGMDVFVLGYPFGAAPPSFPVWKRGSIASEPGLVQIGEKFYLVDTASRPGMSGAPVILRTYGTHLTESGPSTTTAPATKFLGIYSGRLQTKDSGDTQLGRVWPEAYITDIIDTNRLDPGAD